MFMYGTGKELVRGDHYGDQGYLREKKECLDQRV